MIQLRSNSSRIASVWMCIISFSHTSYPEWLYLIAAGLLVLVLCFHWIRNWLNYLVSVNTLSFTESADCGCNNGYTIRNWNLTHVEMLLMLVNRCSAPLCVGDVALRTEETHSLKTRHTLPHYSLSLPENNSLSCLTLINNTAAT